VLGLGFWDLVDELSFVDDFPDAGGAVAGTDADTAFRGEGGNCGDGILVAKEGFDVG
jgi:hypothetical protein